ncbi:hypothetical protein M378DRAFT_172074 [Amanita muscaria Koide BX008]|uniref:Uncharacterized protein n=1 Tax=Amanita muscaria (strain Koide BX008) TaxID=946122 RepID=A0A0C2WLT9_AMAMK|nr:hypothetical protein M378DRAFT_172074 [Amanita muscaria Koide BX008]
MCNNGFQHFLAEMLGLFVPLAKKIVDYLDECVAMAGPDTMEKKETDDELGVAVGFEKMYNDELHGPEAHVLGLDIHLQNSGRGQAEPVVAVLCRYRNVGITFAFKFSGVLWFSKG